MFYATNVYGHVWCYVEPAETLMSFTGEYGWMDRTDPQFGANATPVLCSGINDLATLFEEEMGEDLLSGGSGYSYHEVNTVVKF